jgi:hypothetical protein
MGLGLVRRLAKINMPAAAIAIVSDVQMTHPGKSSMFASMDFLAATLRRSPFCRKSAGTAAGFKRFIAANRL